MPRDVGRKVREADGVDKTRVTATRSGAVVHKSYSDVQISRGLISGGSANLSGYAQPTREERCLCSSALSH